MKKHLFLAALMGLIFGSIHPVTELPLKPVRSPELRFEYAMAKLGCKTSELKEMSQLVTHNPYLDIPKNQQETIEQLGKLLYGQRRFNTVVAAYNKNIDAGILAAQELIKDCAKELEISLANTPSRNQSITEEVTWIEESVKKIIKKYKSFSPRSKSSLTDSIGRLLLLNSMSQFVLTEGESIKGYIASGLFGALTSRLIERPSSRSADTAPIKDIAVTITAFIGLLYSLKYLQAYSQKLIKKDERLTAYKNREKAIKDRAYLGIFDYLPGNIGFGKIAGIQNDETIRTLSFYADWLKRPIRYNGKDNGRKAIVLYGEPGNGKGTITKALADEAQTPIISINSSDLTSEGLSDKLAIAEIHATRSKNKAMIVLFDEIDLSTGDFKGKNANEAAMQKLLTTLDGVQTSNPHTRILFVFATNYINKLDPRMLRPGRIQHKLYVGPPTFEQRATLFAQLLAHLPLPEEAYAVLAKATDQYSRVAIEDIVLSVLQQGTFEERTITVDDFLKEIETKKHSVFQSSTQIA